MKTKLFTLFLTLVVSVGTVFAWDYEQVPIGDLYYNLDATNQTAEVTYKSYSNSDLYNKNWNITSAVIPQSVEYQSVTYSVISIGEPAFYNCYNLVSIEIPNSVTSIGENAFCGCSNLTSINVNSSNQRYCSDNGILFNKEMTILFAYPAGKQENTYIIPESVTSIGESAFFFCSSIVSVICEAQIPPTLGFWTFARCYNLSSIYVPCGTLDAYKQSWSEYMSIIKNAPFPYTIIAENGKISTIISTAYTICDESANVACAATPNYGYHFVQWADGNTDNPRTFVLTQDTTITAEFAKNEYNITTESNISVWGVTAGDTTALYLEEVEISATPNYGYHFDHWKIEKYSEYIEYNITHNPYVIKFSVPDSWTNPYAWIWEEGKNSRWEPLPKENDMYVYRETKDNQNIILVPNGATWDNGQTNDLAITESCCYTIIGEKYGKYYEANKTYDCLSPEEQNIITGIDTFAYVDTTTSIVSTNPLPIVVTSNQKAIAHFAKNTYSITKVANSTQGSISGNSSAEYLDEVTLTANP